MGNSFTLSGRLEALLSSKKNQTEKKYAKFGRTQDMDDRGNLVAPDSFIFTPVPNHESSGFFGPYACGMNYKKLLHEHPVTIDENAGLLGSWMVMLLEYKKPLWNPDINYEHLHKEQKLYDIVHGIGGVHHFLPDYSLGLKLGFKGIKQKIKKYEKDGDSSKIEFYKGLNECVEGIFEYIKRHIQKARQVAADIKDIDKADNLLMLAEMNEELLKRPAKTFHEAVQWMAWYLVCGNMYNGGASAVGDIDRILKPYYDNDIEKGILTKEQAIFYICNFLIIDNAYCQIGGCDEFGKDNTNELSHVVLEAVHKMKIPASVCVRVHENIDKEFFRKAVKYLLEDRTGSPNFVSDKAMVEGFIKNGYSKELAVSRVKCGCHWCAIPGKEYTLNDIVKINFVAVFDAAYKQMMEEQNKKASVNLLWQLFTKHLERAVAVTAQGMDFQIEHMHEVFPELLMDLLCHGPIEKGLDASNGGLEYINLCVDGAGLAVVADSLAALKERIEDKSQLNWQQIHDAIINNYEGYQEIFLMMKNSSHYGYGGTTADRFAVKIVNEFVKIVKKSPTPNGHNMIPGLFSWANTIPMGKAVGATANGRLAYTPISHGANPLPGFKDSGALTAMAKAVASVQCGYGNTVPIQLEINPITIKGENGINNMMNFISVYLNKMGGTLMNINILDKEKILDAHSNPSKYPDLIVRVTGFCAYFALLSEDFRKLVVDRIINE